MRQVNVGKAFALGVFACAISAAVSGGAVYTADRDKVRFGVVDENTVLAACAVMKLMKEANPGMRVALHPSLFDPRLNPPKK